MVSITDEERNKLHSEFHVQDVGRDRMKKRIVKLMMIDGSENPKFQAFELIGRLKRMSRTSFILRRIGTGR